MIPRWLLKIEMQNFLSSLSAEELMEILGGSERVIELMIKGFEMCNPKEKERLRKSFFGEELWERVKELK